MNHVEWSKPALRDLASLEPSVAEVVQRAVERFAASGVGDIKKLQGIEPPELRLRVAQHRVVFRQIGD